MTQQPQRQHILTRLPTSYRPMMQHNALRYHDSGYDAAGQSISDALDLAFNWSYTRQGSDYHYKMGVRYERIQSGASLITTKPLCQTHPNPH